MQSFRLQLHPDWTVVAVASITQADGFYFFPACPELLSHPVEIRCVDDPKAWMLSC